ncbi:MAG TPA: ATP-binding protein [Solirubrobacteraceae bacterium]|jgi:signal transduction histidine kinase|nr:ATP-binding protein [Solirubrobacteraceae bacterium]
MRAPRRTVRLKLTLLYGTLFLISGGILLTITNLVVRNATSSANVSFIGRNVPPPSATRELPSPRTKFLVVPAGVRGNPAAIAAIKASQQRLTSAQGQVKQVATKLGRVITFARRQPSDELHNLLITSLLALGVMAVISIVLGWLVAGRVLRPLRTITAAARDISATSLDQRLALDGPNDELHELGSTFDGLLGRLEASFEAQRQFVANASHELRTPLARQRTVAEVALGDPDATVESLRASHERVLAAGEQQERLIEALLTLARSERGIERREPFDLAPMAEAVLATREHELEERGLELETALESAPVRGEPRLVERLVANLVDNAVRHNVPGGSVHVSTRTSGSDATISVVNTGPVVPPDDVERLLQPFERLDGSRVADRDGVGLGLSIADAIARAHAGALLVRAQPAGGFAVQASFPG